MAWTPLGWEPAAFSEIEPFPCSVLQHHYPHVPNLGDVTKITRQQVEALGRIDLVCGGFPCQDLSAAGKRKGLMNADGSPTRSGLFFDAMRIAEWTRARWTVLENVPGLFSSNGGRDFAAVVGEMAGCEFDVPPGGWENAGVAVGPLGLIEWITLDAQYVRVESHPRAVPQRRRRVFLVRDSGNWANRPPLFLERESLRGHPAPSREAGKDAAGCLASRTDGGGFPGTDEDCSGYVQPVVGPLACNTGPNGHDAGNFSCNQAVDAGHILAFGGNNQSGPIDVATARNACASASGRMDFESETFLVQPTHSLRGEGFDASEDGTGRGTPLVPVGVTIHGTDPTVQKVASLDETAQCLRARTPGNIDNSSTTVVMQPVSFAIQAGALRTNPLSGPDVIGVRADHAYTPSVHINAGAVAFQPRHYSGRERMGGEPSDVCHTLSAQAGQGDSSPHVAHSMQVRRLTPVECERLQGFPDGYTAIPWRKKPASECPDGPRYKSLGNSWAVNCARWIGERIEAVETIVADQAELETA